jgi:hypothetical protein
VLLGIVLALVLGGFLLWYLTYGVDATTPDRLALSSLQGPVEILWGEQEDLAISASNEADAMTGLGYVHGHRRAWSVALWRQAATGRLSEWFGEPAFGIDHLTRQLGLAEQAQASYAALSNEEKALLRAYTDGMNAAMAGLGEQLRYEFVVLDVEPDPWQPWHTLAIERLFAWLTVVHPARASLPTDAAVDAFYAADQDLKQWLRLHGFENSMAWAIRDTSGTHFFQRQVYGASALPFLVETSLSWDDAAPIWGASLPGTPFFLAGKNDTYAWSLLPTGAVQWTRARLDSTGVKTVYQRIVSREGTESLATFPRLPGAMPLADSLALARADSIWILRWNGLSPGTDFSSWRALLQGEETTFHLLDGNGLALTRDGTIRVLGTPPLTEPLPTGVFVGNTSWAAYAADLLQNQESDHVQLGVLIDDAYSTWAAQMAPPLIGLLQPVLPDEAPLRDAHTYLRNWDFSYDEASIGASIFDTWLAMYQSTYGSLPETDQDTTFLTPPRYLQTFRTAVDTLTARYGPDLSQWRWETVQANRRLFPIWSVDTLRHNYPRVITDTRYAPIDLPGQGHPSSLTWGPSPVQPALPAPSAWEAWIHTETWDHFTVRRHRLNVNAPMGRYLISDRPPSPVDRPQPNASSERTLLTPRRPAP